MSGQLPLQPASVFESRRSALAARLGPTPALLFAGGMRARNYPANVFPFRADSHFLYLAGAAMADAALLVHEGVHELFVVPKADDDALWHGSTPGESELRTATGVSRVRPRSELAGVIASLGGGDKIATLPAPDPITRARQCTLLGRNWSAEGYPAVIEYVEIDHKLADAMIEGRIVHDEAAIHMMRTALTATTAAHLAGMAVTRPGIRESDVRAAMEHEVLARDMTTAYGSIVTVHGEVLHSTTYHGTIESNDLVLADVGAEYGGWASDITRTWPASGTFSATQRALYDIVLQAELDAIDMVRPGVRYRDVHLKSALTLTQGLVDEGILVGRPETLVERGAHAILFPHGVGHLLGLDVHDMEDLGDRAGYAPGRKRSEQFGLGYLRLDRDLQAGMAVTIEPGLYFVPAILNSEEICGPFVADGTLNRDALSRFSDVRGIRIEDDVLCTPTGPEVLSAAIPKDAEAVQAQVQSVS